MGRTDCALVSMRGDDGLFKGDVGGNGKEQIRRCIFELDNNCNMQKQVAI